jgi:hypothetical protein
MSEYSRVLYINAFNLIDSLYPLLLFTNQLIVNLKSQLNDHPKSQMQAFKEPYFVSGAAPAFGFRFRFRSRSCFRCGCWVVRVLAAVGPRGDSPREGEAPPRRRCDDDEPGQEANVYGGT